MLHYFIHREASDGMPNNDSKNLNTRAFPLFKAGHIQYVYYKKLDEKMLMKCSCLPEMKKTLSYSIRVAFTICNSNIIFAVCSCPAGNGPTCTCKHIGAFCYFLEEFCRLNTVSYSSCTSSLQMWHQPRKRQSTPCTLNNIKFIKAEYGKEKWVISTNYDPRPVAYRGTASTEITSLQHQLKSLGTPVALLHVLPQATATCSTDSAITKLPLTPRSLKTRVQAAVMNEPQPLSLMSLYKHGMDFLNMITLSKEDISNVEAATKGQSDSRRWYEERHCRLTSSNFGELCKGCITTNKVKSVVYGGFEASKASNSAILWGKLHESDAFSKYEAEYLPENMKLDKSGIHILPQKGFLAASPDGIVTNDSKVAGIIEIKCPYSARNLSVHEACLTLKQFYCQIIDGKACLKTSHPYYFQIQGAMAIVGVEWCDFIVWTLGDMTVERIIFNKAFLNSCSTYLESIYLSYILP